MEPISILLLLLVTFFGTGAGRQVYKRTKRRRKEELREALLKKFPAPDRYVSLFDIFWDLGVSDYALTIMGHQDLLPKKADDIGDVFHRLDSRIQDHGSYEAFIADVLEAIQEFYEEHRAAGDRRLLPTLETRTQKLLPVGQGEQPTATTGMMVAISGDKVKEEEVDGLPDGYLLDIELEERARVRESRMATNTALVPVGSHGSVDIDDLLRASPLDILKGLLGGRFGERLNKWVQLRELRGLRAELDGHLGALYRYFERSAASNPDFFAPLYDLPRRWEREAIRIELLERHRPWKEREDAQACDLLIEEARILARYLSRHAKKNTDDALGAIRDCANKGDTSMAGYLVYVNRFAFFAGRGDGHASIITEIEYATAKIQAELRALQEKHVI